MPTLNQITIQGNLTRDPEFRDVGRSRVCNITIGSNRSYKDKSDEWQTETTFVDIKAWGEAAGALDGLHKGDEIIVRKGALKQDTWADRNTGARRTKLYVLAFEIERGRQRGDRASARQAAPDDQPHDYDGDPSDIPF